MSLPATNRHADPFRALDDANRRRLLELLDDRERCVQELVPHLDITVGAVSQHLKVLLESGLVVRRKQGRHRYYRTRARALREVHDWTGRFRAHWEASLDRLGEYLDGPA